MGLTSIPCVIGSTYTTQIERLRPDTPPDVMINTGGAGLLKRHFWYSLLVGQGIANTVMIGGDQNLTLYPATFTNPKTLQPTPTNTIFTGVHRDTIEDDYNLDGQMYLTVTRPVPLTLNGMTGFMDTNEIAGEK